MIFIQGTYRRFILRLVLPTAARALLALSAVAARAADEKGSISEQPFAAHPNPPGKTMFVELAPEQTGVRAENKFNDPKMRGELYQEFETSSVGTGVTIGDYDGDGRPDIFIVSKTESCRLFRNLGNLKFEDVTARAGVEDVGADAIVWKQGATFVDVNNDGRLDLYVCRFNAPNRLYLNQGNGTFKEQAQAYGLDIRDSSVMAAFADYDRDGWLDVYIATNILDIAKHPNGQRGYMLHNNRDGTYSNVTERAGISGERQSHSATWWDYDDDGWPDLYVAYDYGLPDNLYRNNRDGTFTDVTNRALPHTSFSSMGSDVGDVNNDGLIDFFVSDMAATTHAKDHHMTADFRARNDLIPDDPGLAPKYHRNALLLNTGTGRALEGAFLAGLAATDWTWSVRLEDLDNDGFTDLFVTNGFPRDPSVDVIKRMQSTETPAERVKIMYATPVLAENHHAFRNLGDLRFEDASAEWGLGQKGVAYGAAVGDLAGDGNLAIVYANHGAGATFLRNDNSTGHRVIIELRGKVSNRFGIGATVMIESALGVQIRPLTLSRGYMSSSEPMAHFGLGGDTIIRRMTVTWPSGHVQTFENVGVDRRFTITEPNIPAPSAAPVLEPASAQFSDASRAVGFSLSSQEEPVDETAQQKLLYTRLNRRGPSVAVAHLDGGAKAVFVGGTTLTRASLLVGSASKALAPVDTSALLPLGTVNDGPALFFDADGDGKSDLLVTKGGNALPAGSPEYQPLLFVGDGTGHFRTAAHEALPAYTNSAGAIAAADFNRSDRLGVFIGGRVLTGSYPDAAPSCLLANRGGKFEDVTDTVAPGLREVGMVTGAIWSDVDGDGWMDLLLTLEWGEVKYFHNDGGTHFEDRSNPAGFAAAGTGWWSGIASGDFNSDGRPDFVVGNLGLNTQYRADPKHPALLYSGDFRGNGGTQLIEAFYEGEKIYPWRTRRDLGAAIPSVLTKYPRWDMYERATLPEILGENKITKAARFAATEFQSGIFLSQSNGTYQFTPLPRLAQISTIQGIVCGDFDGDGRTDIYVVQNSFAPLTLVGRNDGGLSQLLRGDGTGRFTPVPVRESGLVVPGDGEAVATLDLEDDGWADFLVTRNHNSSLAFNNRGAASHHPLRISLRGSKGNPSAVGARITVIYADGTSETAEVSAGSGYYSQSAPECYFGYSNANPPKRVQVRWPAGSTTEHAIELGSPTLTIAGPSA